MEESRVRMVLGKVLLLNEPKFIITESEALIYFP